MSDYKSRQERKNQMSKKKASTAKKTSSKGFIKKFLLIFFIVLLIGGIAGGVAAVTFIADAPELDPKLLKDAQTSVIYDKNDEEIQNVSVGWVRDRKKISEIPELVQNAFISTEDVRFREHFGIDVRRIGGAVLANFKEGFGAEGASTITQQVIKNSFLSPEKSLKRKVQEAYLSVKLEQQYSKDQILEMYLNKIFFGNRAYGVAAAADIYYGKELKDLNPGEAALLAGLPKAPSYYNPYKNPDKAAERRNVVLGLMAKHNVITDEEAAKYKKVKVQDMLAPKKEDEDKYQVFIEQVIDELLDIEGLTEKDIYQGGIKIYTTLDPKAQDIAENAVNNYEYRDELIRTGMVLLDTQSGAIRAIADTRKDDKIIHYATGSPGQPGSTIKPILDYGPAIEYEKWSTGHQIKDQKLVIDGTNIRNWDGNYRGHVSMREALRQSWNVPAVNTYLDIGPEKANDFANGLGMDMDKTYPVNAIGGFTHGTSPLKIAGAYAAFGNEGIYTKPYSVRKIVYPDNRELDTKPESAAAMSDYTAYMITDMLKTVVDRGTGTKANIPGLHMAGKTGTTNFDKGTREKYGIPSGKTKDAWFSGYTTEYTAALWTGFNSIVDKDGNPHYLENQDTKIPQYLFKDIMSQLSNNPKDFQKPDSVVELAIEKDTGLLPSDYTPEDQIVHELFVKGHTPDKVSKKYDKTDAPTGLKAEYNEETNEIKLSWKPGGKDDVTYELSMSADGGEFQSLTTTDATEQIIGDIEPGSNLTFRVVATDKETNVSSDPAETSISVPKKEDDKVPDPLEDDDNGDQDGGTDGEGSGNDNGTGNNGGDSGNGNDGTGNGDSGDTGDTGNDGTGNGDTGDTGNDTGNDSGGSGGNNQDGSTQSNPQNNTNE
ncbi:PBP1A family penicillin-binding protein [Pseudalkalibacillus caeni]|uniref:PBP1A family penicillin-binding protein n=1 Tax=Exobacillus caeni TaxID=2574798 RepID=A0A5R9F0B5_9BACL|nr:PBP1A family penicillin-binding protein [Pseudalkalibacillus caeni]TLS35876.1 PBP1A family penicillin-binding protein [Pseudalkalibacillus caeni]